MQINYKKNIDALNGIKKKCSSHPQKCRTKRKNKNREKKQVTKDKMADLALTYQ